jgi:hypothetical protein
MSSEYQSILLYQKKQLEDTINPETWQTQKIHGDEMKKKRRRRNWMRP